MTEAGTGTTKVFTLEAVAVLALVGLRAISVSNYQPETALAVLDKAGLASVALGSVVPLIPDLLPWAVLVLASGTVLAAVAGDADRAVKSLVLSWAAALGSLLLTPTTHRSLNDVMQAGLARWWGIALVLGVLAVVRLLDAFVRHRSDPLNNGISSSFWGVNGT